MVMSISLDFKTSMSNRIRPSTSNLFSYVVPMLSRNVEIGCRNPTARGSWIRWIEVCLMTQTNMNAFDRYIIPRNHKIVTFIIRLHVLIGGIGSCVLVAHATLGKTKSLLSG
jgi:hypothetical protein